MVLAASLLLISACVPDVEAQERNPVEQAIPTATAQVAPVAVEEAQKTTISSFLSTGVVIVISKASQQMYVFADGALWGSSPVSTGRKGKETPSGVFAILQKKVFHRSNLYNNAPMPFMQRLTWSGIAIHAGHLPGYPASHGCIRLPQAFAKDLYDLTGFTTTGVIITNDPLATDEEALLLAQATDAKVPIDPRRLSPGKPDKRPAARSIPQRRGDQTIQLIAALSSAEASAHWGKLLQRRPELGRMRMTIVPAVVNGRQYYRLRATASGAHSTCRDLKRSGIDCFPVS
ncbi:L,D-transpeptidase family protein [Parerythrobacter aestuarii]|uniref:L,D-transpeptidase family protein n=1 Tax=Parerythrobacter aestuarii TaxID=3020909 RepID=UPI0024DE66DB|nr:L,D-transpeptidase family protein [Parerythrobacter aestuarii]